MRLQDKLNHILGSYIAVGIAEPKKYPDKPILSEDNAKNGINFTSDESLDAYICSLANNMKG